MMRHDTDEKSSESEGIYIMTTLYTSTQQKLIEHFGASLNHKVSHLMAQEIDRLKYPAAQTMMDIYHKSGAKSWSQFVNNSSLHHLRKNHQQTFSILQSYQSEFTQNIYAPLSQYLAAPHNLFKGEPNKLIQQISEMYNHLKLRKIAPNCCMQIDLRSRHDMLACQSNYDTVEWSLDDEVYEADIDDDAIIDGLRSSSNKPMVSICGIDQMLRQCVMPSSDGNYCYKRYEVLSYGTKIESFQAVSNNSIPQCAFKNGPLCMIFNSTTSTKQILNEFCTEKQGLITVSFHVYDRTINVYMYVADDKGKLFGSRIFGDDLLTTIRLLFEDNRVDMQVMNEINYDLQFKPDAAYKKYYSSLIRHGINQNEIDSEQKLDPLFVSELEEIMNASSIAANEHIMNTIIQCFIQNDINYVYFKNHKRKDFVQLLRECEIKVSVAIKIWKAFTENPSVCNDNNKRSMQSKAASLRTTNTNKYSMNDGQQQHITEFIEENKDEVSMRHSTDKQFDRTVDDEQFYIRNNEEDEVKSPPIRGNEVLLKKLQLLQHENDYLKQENNILKRIMRKMEDTTSDSDSSSDQPNNIVYDVNEQNDNGIVLDAINDEIELRPNQMKTYHVCLVILMIITWFAHRIW